MGEDGKKQRGLFHDEHTPLGAVRDLALIEVEKLILKGYNARAILAVLSERNYTESMQTVYRLCGEVRRRLAEQDIENRDARRNIRRAQLEARYLMLLEDIEETRCLPNMPAKGMAIAMMHRAAAQCEQLMIKLDGLDAAVKIEVSGFIDIKAMAPEQRKQRIDELLQKREAAKMLPPGDQVH